MLKLETITATFAALALFPVLLQVIRQQRDCRGAGLTDTAPKDVQSALARAESSVAAAPLDVAAYQQRGELLLDLGRYDEARADFCRMHALDPHHGGSFYGLACLEALSGHRDLALRYLAGALHHDPGLALAATREKSLASLRNDARFHALLSGDIIPRVA